jgi:4-aminobutyrate aminotransferase-like enzyme
MPKILRVQVKNRLEKIKVKHKSVGDVRSIGLFGAVELTKNREKKRYSILTMTNCREMC